MASEAQNGSQEELPLYPFELRFEPTPGVKQIFALANLAGYTDFRLPFALVPPGPPIFQVYARDRPEILGGLEVPIASIVITSEIVPSKWGDEGMFFRHERYDADLRMRPDWKPFVKKYKPPEEENGAVFDD